MILCVIHSYLPCSILIVLHGVASPKLHVNPTSFVIPSEYFGGLYIYNFGLGFSQKKKFKTLHGIPHKLIRDCAYPMQTWIYSSSKGCTKGFEGYKANWNFIRSSTRMCVECAFNILKGKWRIILRMVDVLMRHVVDIVATYAIQDNIVESSIF